MNLSITTVEYTPTPWGHASSTVISHTFYQVNLQNTSLKPKAKKIKRIEIVIDRVITLDVLINGSSIYTYNHFPKARYLFTVRKNTSLRYQVKIQLPDSQTHFLKTLILGSPSFKTAEWILNWVFYSPTFEDRFSQSPELTFPLNWAPFEKYEVACLQAKLQRVALKFPDLLPSLAEWGRYSEKHYRRLEWLDIDISSVGKINSLIERLDLTS